MRIDRTYCRIDNNAILLEKKFANLQEKLFFAVCSFMELLSRGQFHQHFTRGFFVRKFCAKLFVLAVKVKLFIGARMLAQMRFKNVGEIDSRKT
jgi:hypothetical protein